MAIPMALKGEASVALGGAVIASVFGGVFSLVVMTAAAGTGGLASPSSSGPSEIFALVLFGLSTICGLAVNARWCGAWSPVPAGTDAGDRRAGRRSTVSHG
jgi:TctA family transporter